MSLRKSRYRKAQEARIARRKIDMKQESRDRYKLMHTLRFLKTGEELDEDGFGKIVFEKTDEPFGLTADVLDTILNCGYMLPPCAATKSFRILQLGKAEKVKKEEDMQRVKAACASLANTANAETSVSFVLKKDSDGISTLVSGSNAFAEETVTSSLKAHFAFADVKEDTSRISDDYLVTGKAQCLKYKRKDSTQNPERNWMDALIFAAVQGRYKVSVRIDAVPKNNVQNRLSELVLLSQDLRDLNDFTFNITTGLTENVTGSDALGIIDVLKKLRQSKTVSDSTTTNSQMSISQVQKEDLINQLNELTAEKIRSVTKGLTSEMKCVSIIVEADSKATYQTATSIIGHVLTQNGYVTTWVQKEDGSDFENIFSVDVPSADVKDFLALPTEEHPGFKRPEIKSFAVIDVDNTEGLPLGEVFWNNALTEKQFCVVDAKLNRHTSVFGMTGCGKSNTVLSILEKTNSPFLVIEPVKSEYRTLINFYRDTCIHHMDPEKKGVLRINPFWFPRGGSLSFHMDALKKIISSAFALYAAMPNILEQCIFNCYVKKGWNVVTSANLYADSVPEEYLYPTFSDLCDEIELYLTTERSGFEGETLSTYRGALITRLKSFKSGLKGVLLNTTEHPNYEEWTNSRQIVELDGLADDADKSIVMGSLIMQYYQCVKNGNFAPNQLKHLIVVEEAHRLFKNSSQVTNNPEVAAPEAQLVDTLSNMLAEIRAYGEGFIIVDQSPVKVSPDIVSNTSTKIVHRLDNKQDIEIIESSLLMKDISIAISSLAQGDAILRTEGMEKPIKLHMNKSRVKDSDEQVKLPASEIDLSVSSSVDFIINNDVFCKDYISLMKRFINNLLYDDLKNAQMFFCAALNETERLLYLHGFSEITLNAGEEFYLQLIYSGIQKALQVGGTWSNLFVLQFLMFSKRFCAILAKNNVKSKNIDLFTEYRANILHPQIEIKNRNAGVAADFIAKICGFYSIYTDVVLEFVSYIDAQNLDFSGNNSCDIKTFDDLFRKCYGEFFIAAPIDFVKDNIVLITRSVIRDSLN